MRAILWGRATRLGLRLCAQYPFRYCLNTYEWMCPNASDTIADETLRNNLAWVWLPCAFAGSCSCARVMWFSRKIGPMIALSSLVGGAVAVFMRTTFELYTQSIPLRILLYIAPAAAIFLFLLLLNIRMIYWCGSDELAQRIQAQWSERILACVENRNSRYKFGDVIDYLALSEIWIMKCGYKIRAWDWKDDEN